MEEQLKDLSAKVMVISVGKLQILVDKYDGSEYHNGCPLQHIAEMVKLYHQAKSLLTPA